MSISEKPTKLQGELESETKDDLIKFQEEEKLTNSFQIKVKKPASGHRIILIYMN